ncbi:MAG: cob(I)yrinic acid a,c-diamide adenosyltransferase [bacterium]|nr:cob(I)yrinic acid a,c-diamide adenosyltransferase [bacterium]
MLYTRKGDDGTTKLFGCDQQRISKSSAVAEALGNLDEINSFLGLAKVRSGEQGLVVKSLGEPVEKLVCEIQHTLFIVQAELAGAEKTVAEAKVKHLEKIIANIESEMPPIKSFFVSGGTELAATFDFARTIARRAERRVVQVVDEDEYNLPAGRHGIGEYTRQYLNRLSSVLYAFARYTNFTAGVKEEPPSYE